MSPPFLSRLPAIGSQPLRWPSLSARFLNRRLTAPGQADALPSPDASGSTSDRSVLARQAGSGQDGDPLAILLAEAAQIVEDGIQRYFADRHARVKPFVDTNFSLRGTLALHRAAIGWDIARAPLNLSMAAPQAGLFLAAAAARKFGANRLAGRLQGRRLLVRTAVADEIAWRIRTDLLELPAQETGREFRRDALAETILSDPRITDVLRPVLAEIGTRQEDAELRARLTEAIEAYGATRAAAAEITTALFSLCSGALALHKLTPGAMSLGPALAGLVARHAALASFPMGGAIGGLWYSLFPVAPSALLVAGMTGGLMAVSTVAAAFAGVIADPVQRRLGLHDRRLHRLIDTLERQVADPEAPGFVAHDHYVARLLDLFDLIGAAYRLAR